MKELKGFTTVILILSGTMFSAFIFLVGIYAASPGFREHLTGAVAGDSNIPVIRNDGARLNTIENEETALSHGALDTEERTVVDREYNVDTEGGEGYWIITYSDGTTETE